MTASFVEVTSRGWAFWRALVDTGIGLIVGVLYAFVGILVIGIVGEEALSSIYRGLDLDPLFRASMGVILAAGAVLALVFPFLVAAERFAAMRAAERSAEADPEGVPQRLLRDELANPPHSQLLLAGRIMLWGGAAIGGLMALGVIFADDLREHAESWITIAAAGGLAAIGAVVAGLAKRGAKGAEDRLRLLRSRWAGLVASADAADARRRESLAEEQAPRWLAVPGTRLLDRIPRALLAATLLSFGAFFLSVFMRQQCRGCDPVYWNEPIENGIDVLSLGSGIAVAACGSAALIAWVGGVGLQLVRERALAGWCVRRGPRRIDLTLVTPLIVGNRALVRLQRGLGVVGGATLIVGLGALWADWNTIDPHLTMSIGGAVVALGFLLGWSDAARSARERQIIRTALLPGDAPQEARKDRRAGVRRRPR